MSKKLIVFIVALCIFISSVSIYFNYQYSKRQPIGEMYIGKVTEVTYENGYTYVTLGNYHKTFQFYGKENIEVGKTYEIDTDSRGYAIRIGEILTGE